jgi:hypothetical protein
MELVKNNPTFAQLAWTEFQTRFQVPGPSFKLGPRFFFTFMYYIKNKAQQLVD